MGELTEWRGFDLRPRLAKIQRAFARAEVTSADDIPILVNTPCYFAFGSTDKPPDYFTNPASMVDYQARGYEKHLHLVDDDYVPYFMPWFGTGVLASGFGSKVHIPEEPGDDPAVVEPLITSPADAARLKLPDPYRDGWMPRVLDAIDYARAYSDLPPGLTDMQGPLDTLGLMCGQARLFQWMYQEPQMVHELFELVTQAFIDWVKVQKQHIGEPLDCSNGLQGTVSPGAGVWESDDDLVLIDPGLYREFVVPHVSRIFTEFGGGSVHFCGNGTHHLENLLRIQNLAVVNNSPLGNFDAFAHLRKGLGTHATIQIQDASPADPESYYPRLLAGVDDFRGIMIAMFVLDNAGMDNQGGYMPVNWDPYQVANRIVKSVREVVAKRLAGEADGRPSAVGRRPSTVDHRGQPSAVGSRSSTEQVAALKEVRDRLIDFDGKGLQEAIRAALATGLAPFDIIIGGMAEGMNEVGRLYEAGEFFLPQLVMAGATMQEGMAVLQPLLQGAGGAAPVSKGRVVLGTVKGDLHDIGKNLVKLMLEGAGFEVIDLGVDVAPEKFVQAAQAHDARLVAMSALLTTTLRGMQQTVEALEAAGLRDQVQVMIGGAPVSREYADQIGAEGYAPSAVQAVAEAERLLRTTVGSGQ